MMLSRINMAKSSYQLHNGQATWLRSEQHHLQRKDVCMCIYSRCVCVCVLPAAIYLESERVSGCTLLCVLLELWVCVRTWGALIKGL